VRVHERRPFSRPAIFGGGFEGRITRQRIRAVAFFMCNPDNLPPFEMLPPAVSNSTGTEMA